MDTFESALTWVKRGCAILPCQPSKKWLYRGFGEYLDRLTELEELREWFPPGSYNNLAILAAPGLLCLDFDDPQLFVDWQEKAPLSLAKTYCETSPNGFHAFMWCKVPARLTIAAGAGIEVKKIIVVAPSRLAGFKYTPLDEKADIAVIDNYLQVLSDFPFKVEERPAISNPNPGKGDGAGWDLISRIKVAWPVLDLAKELVPTLKPREANRRWWMGCCPFHDDSNPSFWVDSSRQRWGCHTCAKDKSGDVIDLYARAHDLPIKQAIKVLAQGVQFVR